MRHFEINYNHSWNLYGLPFNFISGGSSFSIDSTLLVAFFLVSLVFFPPKYPICFQPALITVLVACWETGCLWQNNGIGSSLLDVESSQCSDTMVCFDRYLSIWPLHNQTNPNMHNPKAVKYISLRRAHEHWSSISLLF